MKTRNIFRMGFMTVALATTCLAYGQSKPVDIPQPVAHKAALVSAKVIYVRADKVGRGIVKLDRDLTGTIPECVSDVHHQHFGFDTKQPAGQAMFHLLLDALRNNGYVQVGGAGACSIYGSVEDLNYAIAKNR